MSYLGLLLKEEIHSVVVMGAGEPLQNYDNVLQALQLLHDPMICNISYRKMRFPLVVGFLIFIN